MTDLLGLVLTQNLDSRRIENLISILYLAMVYTSWIDSNNRMMRTAEENIFILVPGVRNTNFIVKYLVLISILCSHQLLQCLP